GRGRAAGRRGRAGEVAFRAINQGVSYRLSGRENPIPWKGAPPARADPVAAEVAVEDIGSPKQFAGPSHWPQGAGSDAPCSQSQMASWISTSRDAPAVKILKILALTSIVSLTLLVSTGLHGFRVFGGQS